jgi:hypothetical protein
LKKPSRSADVVAPAKTQAETTLSKFEEAVREQLAAKDLSTFEGMLTSPLGFGLTTASPLQRAIARAVDGRALGELADDPRVLRAFGGCAPPVVKPSEFAIVSGIRTAKSLSSAGLAIHWSQRADLSRLGPGEIPRISIVSVSKDLADVVFGHVVGRTMASPLLSKLVLETPTADTMMVRHPSGRPVEIKVVASSKAGSSLVARWSAGVILDEVARWGADDAAVSVNDLRDAVLLRILPGAQLVYISSPWAPMGFLYDLVKERWGKPDRDCVVVKAPAYDMAPIIWTPDKLEIAKRDPRIYRTDIEAEFADPEENLFTASMLDSATRATHIMLPPEPGVQYTAAIDPATRGNSFTLVVATGSGIKKKRVVLGMQWTGSAANPLRPAAVLEEIAHILKAYRVTVLDSDQYMGDALRDLANQVGLVLVPHVWTSTERTKRYLTLRTMFELGEVELPPDTTIRQDLQRVVRRYNSTGVSIDLLKSNDGRHADYAPAICMALTRWHEQQQTEQQRQFEEGYQGFTEDEKKIWTRIENNSRAKGRKSFRFRS